MKSPTTTTAALHDDPRTGVFTPSTPPVVIPSNLRRASSHSQLDGRSYGNGLETDGYSEDENILWTSLNGARSRFGSSPTSRRTKLISTGSIRGAGETETELDEPPKHLPTSRRVPTPPPMTGPSLLTRLTPLLFQTFRLLSVVPAVFGALYHLFKLLSRPTIPSEPSPSSPQYIHHPIDHFISILWALLTAHQCLRLTTGLLVRWKAYYPPLATHIRLLALQAICWPATQYTLVLFNHAKRPVICWAIIGSTTSISRSVQIWVTSNLNFWTREGSGLRGRGASDAGRGGAPIVGGQRRWDWTEVGVKCALPMGIMYFIMAWAEAFRREWEGC
ncbi:hypothetical protein M422DRAFT_185957 [Sphaerobolus stellatus SS14]|uniref:Uncharacterized protein n=1 Tax=Sphaerobolus stellatus (strain SS14) TaxID=990650 RepID=A0A0C9V1M6_SPHS4|nr:hypothetical protein M422DRAFT_185957 [Sphaerobolus stellatus SS14]